MPEPEYFVSDGISAGATWATYRRRPTGSLQRVKSPALPLRESREEAERDLAAWLEAKQRMSHQCYDCRHYAVDERCANKRSPRYGCLVTMLPTNWKRPCWAGKAEQLAQDQEAQEAAPDA